MESEAEHGRGGTRAVRKEVDCLNAARNGDDGNGDTVTLKVKLHNILRSSWCAGKRLGCQVVGGGDDKIIREYGCHVGGAVKDG